MGGARDPLAIIVDRLDIIIDLLGLQVGVEPKYVRELRQLTSPVQIQQDTNMLMEMLLSALVPSAPESTEEFTVGVAEVRLAQNESQPMMRVEITNDNVAMPLWITGKQGVLVTTGRIILAQTTAVFVLPLGHSLWGICPIPNASIRVSRGFDFFNILKAIREREQGS